MSNVWSLVKKEVRAYFGSPIAYVVMFSFLLLVGYFFYSLVMWFNAQAMQMAQNPYYAQQVNINEMVFSPLFHNMSIVLIFVIPLLTMRLLAEEKKTGTDEPLTRRRSRSGRSSSASTSRPWSCWPSCSA
jgi:ABC-2 type transport system permease protein